jgi:hypothetical protein
MFCEEKKMGMAAILALIASGCGSSTSQSGDAPIGGGGGDSNPGTPGTAPLIGPCRMFPDDNPWNSDISSVPVHPKSAVYIANMQPDKSVRADWGNASEFFGIPITVGKGKPPVAFEWTTSYGNRESDKKLCPGSGGDFCYPMPTDMPIEGGPDGDAGGDRHALFLDSTGAPNNCTLYEVFNTQNFSAAPWQASNGAIFQLGSNALRPAGFTSADAAGLPVMAGLVRFDEVMAGEIKHAIRMTISRPSDRYIAPATHAAGNADPDAPPMGLRLRLRADFKDTGMSPAGKTLVAAMKKHGLILADGGSSWFITGESTNKWGDMVGGINADLAKVKGSDFVALNTGPEIVQD